MKIRDKDKWEQVKFPSGFSVISDSESLTVKTEIPEIKKELWTIEPIGERVVSGGGYASSSSSNSFPPPRLE